MNTVKNYSGAILTGMYAYQSLMGVGLGVIAGVENEYAHIVYFSGAETHYPVCLLRTGVQCGISEYHLDNADLCSSDEIQMLLNKAEEKRQADQKAELARQERYNDLVNEYKANPMFSHLRQLEKYAKSTDVAKNVRLELKHHFPKTKFSVKTSKGCHTDKISISWTDGPTEKQIKTIAMKFKIGHFDAQQDLQSTEYTPFAEVFGGVDFLSISRFLTDEIIVNAIDIVKAKYDCSDIEMTPELFHNGTLRNAYPNGYNFENLQKLIYGACDTLSLEQDAATAAPSTPCTEPKQAGTTNNTINVSDIIETKHTKKGYDIYVIKLVDRVPVELFKMLADAAKAVKGYYSSYSKGGAIPGFTFKTKADAQSFVNTLTMQF